MQFDEIKNEDFVSTLDGLLREFSSLQQPTDYLLYRLFHQLHWEVSLSSDAGSESQSESKRERENALLTQGLLTHLLRERGKVLHTIESLCEGSVYVWHEDSFNLSVVLDGSIPGKVRGFLQGTLRYGVNVEDEWYAIYLLFQLSMREPYSVEYVVSVQDHDGEVLLIETADVLPEWISNAAPDLTKNRVWIRNGKIHIIPPIKSKLFSNDAHSRLGLYDAVSRIFSADPISGNTRQHTNKINEVISTKLAKYPGHAIALMYTMTVCIPVQLARILNQFPQIISLLMSTLICEKYAGSNDSNFDHSLFASAANGEGSSGIAPPRGTEPGHGGNRLNNWASGLHGIFELSELVKDSFSKLKVDSSSSVSNRKVSGSDENVDIYDGENQQTESSGYVFVPVVISKALYAEFNYIQRQHEYNNEIEIVKETEVDDVGELRMGILPQRYVKLVAALRHQYCPCNFSTNTCNVEKTSGGKISKGRAEAYHDGISKAITIGCNLLFSLELLLRQHVADEFNIREEDVDCNVVKNTVGGDTNTLHPCGHAVRYIENKKSQPDINQSIVRLENVSYMDTLSGTPYQRLCLMLEKHETKMNATLHALIFPELNQLGCSTGSTDKLGDRRIKSAAMMMKMLLQFATGKREGKPSVKGVNAYDEAVEPMEFSVDSSSHSVYKYQRDPASASGSRHFPVSVNDDKWLELTPEQFESEMKQVGGQHDSNKHGIGEACKCERHDIVGSSTSSSFKEETRSEQGISSRISETSGKGEDMLDCELKRKKNLEKTTTPEVVTDEISLQRRWDDYLVSFDRDIDMNKIMDILKTDEITVYPDSFSANSSDSKQSDANLTGEMGNRKGKNKNEAKNDKGMFDYFSDEDEEDSCGDSSDEGEESGRDRSFVEEDSETDDDVEIIRGIHEGSLHSRESRTSNECKPATSQVSHGGNAGASDCKLYTGSFTIKSSSESRIPDDAAGVDDSDDEKDDGSVGESNGEDSMKEYMVSG